MNRDDYINKLQDIFRDIFDDYNLVINESTSSDDIEDWDSLTQISLTTAIEKEFEVKFTIQEFMELNPEIEVELVFDNKELDLSTRQADIGIFMRRPKQLNYIQKKLIDLNYHIYGSPKYLEKHGYPKTINDLNKHKFISFGKGAPSPVYNPDWSLKSGMLDGKKKKICYES